MIDKVILESPWHQDTPNKIIQFCLHCGEVISEKEKYCSLCKTKALRGIMDAENAKINERLNMLRETKQWIYG